MQALELAAVVALLAMSVVLLRSRLARWHADSPAAFQVAVGLGVGLVAALIVLVLQIDLVPDSLEAVTRPVLLAIVAGSLIVVAARMARS